MRNYIVVYQWVNGTRVGHYFADDIQHALDQAIEAQEEGERIIAVLETP